MNHHMRLFQRLKEYLMANGDRCGMFVWQLNTATLDGSRITTDTFCVEPEWQRLKFLSGSMRDVENYCQAHGILIKDSHSGSKS